jgi:hypothetical protein
MISVLAPRTVVRKTGRSPWIISVEMSMNMLTKPSAQILFGRLEGRPRSIGSSLVCIAHDLVAIARRSGPPDLRQCKLRSVSICAPVGVQTHVLHG